MPEFSTDFILGQWFPLQDHIFCRVEPSNFRDNDTKACC